MSEPIKPNATAEFYNTIIPSLSDDANIQEALRMYHYGTTDGSIPDESANPIAGESIAHYLGELQSQIDAFEIGSSYSSTEPSLTNDDNGYIWVDSTSSALIFDEGIPTIAFYQSAEPTTGLVAGMLWVDSDDDSVYVYNGTSWDAIVSGGSSFTPPTTSRLDLFGVQDVTAAAGQAFYYLDGGTTPTPFSVNTVVTTYTKTEISVSIGIQFSTGAVGPISLVRVVNGDLLNPVVIGNYNHANSLPLNINFIDEHGQAPGTILTYGLANYTNAPGGTPDDITFLSIGGIQISSREVA